VKKVILLSPPYLKEYMRNARCDFVSLSATQWYPILLGYCGALLEREGFEITEDIYKLSKILSTELNLKVFGFDLVQPINQDKLYLIDLNDFPGYLGIKNIDIVIIDTAGRLHTKTNLMEELKKIKRVISKEKPSAPHEVLLVVDATSGQNAITQAKIFNDAVGVTGIALTKLDGTAKGGIILAINKELNIPVKLIGVGEAVEDLQDFDPGEFVDALFG